MGPIACLTGRRLHQPLRVGKKRLNTFRVDNFHIALGLIRLKTQNIDESLKCLEIKTNLKEGLKTAENSQTQIFPGTDTLKVQNSLRK